MKSKLNKNKIDYIFFHLSKYVQISNHILSKVVHKIPSKKKPLIFFPLSDNDININFRIGRIPVLYPLSTQNQFYTIDKDKNLIFNHDLLKSAFYLLSGYQESQFFKGDHLGRFTFRESIQNKLNIADFPVVNEYFSIILQGLKEFCSIHNITWVENDIWGDKDFGFFLTHDIDRVDKWTLFEILNRTKMVIRSGFSNHWRYLFEAIKNYNSGENPYWNFEWMKNLEKELGLRSTWFFLPQGHPEIDAYYSFGEKRIRELANYFIESGDEIALHGTYNSRQDKNIMVENLKDVQKLTSEKVTKSRQHWLSFKYPQTLRILENLGIKYDSSWGFAEHYGWRNSYCGPFYPYDLEYDKMMNIQELPLNAMDVTFFQYMGLSLENTYQALNGMLETCKKYNGLFVLLWHNSHFDETVTPGIMEFYKSILKLTSAYSYNNI